MVTAQEKIQRASTKMLLAYPWWASLYLHMKPVETTSVQTMAVDGTHLFFNPDFTLSISDAECFGVLMHETAHMALMHCFRRKYRDPLLWNIACDMAANALLVADNIPLPAGVVPPGDLGKTAEEFYQEFTEQDKANAQKKGIPQDVFGPGECGDGLEDSDENNRNPNNSPVPGSGRMSEADWRQSLAAARGLLPGNLNRAIERGAEPRKDWREELARYVSSTVKSSYHTWNRPSRRIAGLPGWKREPESTIAVCIDTSGSIAAHILGLFLAEITSIAALAGMKLYLISCDAAVTEVIEPGNPIPSTFKGGGTTDFRPAINKAKEFLPDAIVYFTDACGTFPQDCETPVLWALTRSATVPFGEKIELY